MGNLVGSGLVLSSSLLTTPYKSGENVAALIMQELEPSCRAIHQEAWTHAQLRITCWSERNPVQLGT